MINKGLADKIVLMTNGPRAKICEVVVNTLPRDRSRLNIHKHSHYYAIRNHLIDFLVSRSANFSAEVEAGGYDPRDPPLTRPGVQNAGAERSTQPQAAEKPSPPVDRRLASG